MEIDLYKDLPNQIPESKAKILKKVLNKKLTLRPKHNGKTILINRVTKVNESLGKLLGLHVTDGLSSRKCRSFTFVKFTNTDPYIVDSFLNAMDACFGLKRNSFAYKAWYNPQHIGDPQTVGNEWAKMLRLKTTFKYGTQKILIKFKLDVLFYSVILRYILDYLYSRINELMLDNDFSAGFIAAIIAAEGNIYLRKNSVKEVFIAQNNDAKRQVFLKIIYSQSISCKEKIAKKRSGIRITGYNELKKLKESNLCAISKTKAEQFEKGFLKLCKYYKKGRKSWTHDRILQLLSEKPMTAADLAKNLGLSYYTIWDYLKGRRSSVFDKIEPAKNINIKIGRPSVVWRLKNGTIGFHRSGRGACCRR